MSTGRVVKLLSSVNRERGNKTKKEEKRNIASSREGTVNG